MIQLVGAAPADRCSIHVPGRPAGAGPTCFSPRPSRVLICVVRRRRHLTGDGAIFDAEEAFEALFDEESVVGVV